MHSSAWDCLVRISLPEQSPMRMWGAVAGAHGALEGGVVHENPVNAVFVLVEKADLVHAPKAPNLASHKAPPATAHISTKRQTRSALPCRRQAMQAKLRLTVMPAAGATVSRRRGLANAAGSTTQQPAYDSGQYGAAVGGSGHRRRGLGGRITP